MACKSIVAPEMAARIQTVEELIRKVSEARIQELELKVLEALASGMKITDLKIVEMIRWTDKQYEFAYSVKVTKK